MNWIIILAIGTFLFVLFSFKMHWAKRRIMEIFVILGAVLILLFILAISNKNFDFSSLDGVFSSVRYFFSWLVNAGGGALKAGGHAIAQIKDSSIVNSTTDAAVDTMNSIG